MGRRYYLDFIVAYCRVLSKYYHEHACSFFSASLSVIRWYRLFESIACDVARVILRLHYNNQFDSDMRYVRRWQSLDRPSIVLRLWYYSGQTPVRQTLQAFIGSVVCCSATTPWTQQTWWACWRRTELSLCWFPLSSAVVDTETVAQNNTGVSLPVSATHKTEQNV